MGEKRKGEREGRGERKVESGKSAGLLRLVHFPYISALEEFFFLMLKIVCVGFQVRQRVNVMSRKEAYF